MTRVIQGRCVLNIESRESGLWNANVRKRVRMGECSYPWNRELQKLQPPVLVLPLDLANHKAVTVRGLRYIGHRFQLAAFVLWMPWSDPNI